MLLRSHCDLINAGLVFAGNVTGLGRNRFFSGFEKQKSELCDYYRSAPGATPQKRRVLCPLDMETVNRGYCASYQSDPGALISYQCYFIGQGYFYHSFVIVLVLMVD